MSFYEACCHGDLKAVTAFIQTGEQYDKNQGLYYACCYGHLEIVRFLFSKDQWANDLNGGFYRACFNGHLEIVRFLISKGANDLKSGLANAWFGGNLEIIRLLISKGAYEIHKYYQWPRHKNQIMQLLYLGTLLNAFQNVDGFLNLKTLAVNTKQSIVKSNVMLLDLLNLVARCIII